MLIKEIFRPLNYVCKKSNLSRNGKGMIFMSMPRENDVTITMCPVYKIYGNPMKNDNLVR